MLDINGWYYIVALFLFIVVWALSKRLSAGLLAGYVFLFLAVTVLSRVPTEGMKAELVPFWSYRVTELREQTLWNVIAFIPVGVCVGALFRLKGILLGIGISVFVEMIQLITMRGLFEFDDIIHNGIGTVIGVVIWMIFSRILSQKE